MGLEKLFDWIASFWEYINPFVIVREYQEAVVLRYGEFHLVWGKGLHYKIPFIDEVTHQHIVMTTLSLPAQSLLTNDEKNIVVRAVIKYQVIDVKKFILEVYDANDALSDMTQAIIKQVIMDKSFEECMDRELDNSITKKARVEAKKWGIEIAQVTLTDIAPIKTIRLMNDTTNMYLN